MDRIKAQRAGVDELFDGGLLAAVHMTLPVAERDSSRNRKDVEEDLTQTRRTRWSLTSGRRLRPDQRRLYLLRWPQQPLLPQLGQRLHGPDRRRLSPRPYAAQGLRSLVVDSRGCSTISFSHLTIQSVPTAKSGIPFVGAGDAWWSSVRVVLSESTLVGKTFWFDHPDGAATSSVHDWADAQARVEGPSAAGLRMTGSRHEVRASHILLDTSLGIYGTIYGAGDFDLSVEGSLLELRHDMQRHPAGERVTRPGVRPLMRDGWPLARYRHGFLSRSLAGC